MNSSVSAVTFNADGSRMFTAGGMQLKLPFLLVYSHYNEDIYVCYDAISFAPSVPASSCCSSISSLMPLSSRQSCS